MNTDIMITLKQYYYPALDDIMVQLENTKLVKKKKVGKKLSRNKYNSSYPNTFTENRI